MVKYSPFIVLAILAGCATPRVQYKEVKVEVPVVPAPAEHPRPALATETLTPAQLASEAELDKAYKIDILQLKAYVKTLEEIIDKYAEMAKNNPNP